MAATTHTYASSTRKWTWKDILFSLICGAVGLLLVVTQLSYIMVPLFPDAAIHDPEVSVPVMHLWHYAQAGAHGMFLMGLPLLLLAWRPRQHVLLMQFMLVSGVLLALMIAPVRPTDTVTLTVLLGVPIALYPGIRRLFERPGIERLSRPLLGLALLCSPFLLGETVRLVAWQIAGVGGEHATAGHWIASASIPLAVLVAGLMASTMRPGAAALGLVAGLSLVYLGAAAIALPNFDGSWGTRGGVAALVAGLAFVLLTLYEVRRPAAQAAPSRWSSLAPMTKLLVVAVSVLACTIVFMRIVGVGASSSEAGAEELAGLPALATPGFSFDRQEIRAKVGETVALRFDNTHNAPHSFDIDELNVHVRAAPGQASLIRFAAPTAGTYTFYCAIPGHRQAGMEGKLVVEP